MSGYRRTPELEDEEEEFAIVARPIDPIEASLLEQALTEDRIPCRVIGTRDAALLGVAQNAMPLRIEVPRSKLAAAAEIVEAMRHAEPLPDGAIDENDEDHDDHEEATPHAERRKVVLAIGAVLIFFGGSHFYARKPWTAAILAIMQLSAFVMAVAGESFPDGAIGGVAIMTLLIVDVVFGVRAAIAYNRGVRPSMYQQLRDGVLLAVLVAVVAGGATLLGA